MANQSFKVKKSLQIEPLASPTLNTEGDIGVNSTSHKIEFYNGTTTKQVATEDQITDHTGDTSDAHAASAISNTPSGNLAATEVQAALNELQSDVDSRATATSVSDHLSDTTDAHAASAITNTPSGNLAATEVQAALNELQSDIDSRATSTALSDHISDTTAAHAASAIAVTPAGNLAADDVQEALTELQSDIDTRVLASAPEITDPLLMAEEASTPATPASGKFKIYPKDDGKLYTLNDAGTETEVGAGGSSGINYIENPDFESDASGWSITKNTVADAIPDNGFSASSTDNTIARSTSSPLRGTASGLYTLATLGNQLVKPFTIDSADKYKVLQGSFDYSIASGTYADDSVTVWIYDIANAQFIQPAPYLLKNHSLPSERMFFEFQCTDSTSYYLVLHQAAASTAAIKFDNVSVGPQAKLYGSAVTDWQSVSTSSVTGTGGGSLAIGTGGGATYSVQMKKIGDEALIKYMVRIGTSGTSDVTGGYIFPLPTGMSGTFNDWEAIGYGDITNTGTGNPVARLIAKAYAGGFLLDNSDSTFLSAGGSLYSNTNSLTVTIRFKVVGWSSSQIMSQDASTRVVGMRASAVPTGTLAGSFNDVVIGTIKSDTQGSYNTSTGVYTIKVPGYYNISASTRVNSSGSSGAGTAVILRVVQNSTAIARKTEVVQATWSSATLSPGVDVKNVWCNAGDTLKLDIDASLAATLSYDATAEDHWFSVEMSQGPAQIMASESVSCKYRSSSGQSIPNNASTVVNFSTKDWDSNNAVTTGASWKFQPGISGEFEVNSKILLASGGGWGVGETAVLVLRKNGTDTDVLDAYNVDAANTNYINLRGSASIKLLATDYIDVTMYHNSGAAIPLEASANHNFIEIKRTGNY